MPDSFVLKAASYVTLHDKTKSEMQATSVGTLEVSWME